MTGSELSNIVHAKGIAQKDWDLIAISLLLDSIINFHPGYDDAVDFVVKHAKESKHYKKLMGENAGKVGG